ncbi:ankyrin [Plakobranchus ocellatus]|uniref:Ankyrin n=1 Tax=Plakobranchus ocellatus TaxID=259542 RepID=A0AAV4AYU4_9GAST|nr:ankyrin [Plakobranchus ocellatus]
MFCRLDPSEILQAAQLGDSEYLLETLHRHEGNIDCTDSSCKTALWLSLERGELNTLSCLIQAGADINKTYFSKCTPLMLAAERGNVEMLKVLVQNGASIDLCDSFGFSALMRASNKGWTDCLQCLLNAGAQLHQRDTRGRTALMVAAEKGHAECLDLLLKAGATISDKDFKRLSPLMIAVTLDHAACVKVLIQAGAWIDEKDVKGNTGVILSVMHNLKCIKILLECGADPNINNLKEDYPITIAASIGSENTLKQLVGSGAQLDVQDKQGSTALILAAKAGHASCVAYLLSQGACTEIQNHEGLTAAMVSVESSNECLIAMKNVAHRWINMECKKGKTALMYAVICCNVDCVKLLLELGAQVNHQDKQGFTALMSTTFPGTTVNKWEDFWDSRLTIMKLLQNASADLEIADIQGKTAAIHATEFHVPVGILESLNDAGALTKPNSTVGKNSLMFAASAGNWACMEYLIEAGSDVNAVDMVSGKTSMLYVAESITADENKIKCLELLLTNGANVNAQTREKKTALMALAEKCTSPELINLLLDEGAEPDLLDNHGVSAFLHVLKRRDRQHLPLLNCFVQRDIQLQWDAFRKLMLSPSCSEILQEAVINGLMPLSPESPRYKSDLSFIGAALSVEKTEMALYFLASGFLNINDFKVSGSFPQFRLSIEKYKMTYQEPEKRFNPLLSLNQEPWPLVVLCFVTVSSLLGPSPGRRDRVQQTQLPGKLQRKLLFQEPISKLCVSQWSKILPCFNPQEYEGMPRPRPLLDHWPVGRDLNMCSCLHCGGRGFTFL